MCGPTGASRPVVLVVDDHEDTREMYVEFLRSVGMTTFGAQTCSDALQTVTAERVDAIVLDRRLPDGDGNDVCRALKSDPRTRAIAVIILSGQERERSIDADAYLLKPVMPERLVAELERLLARG